jgi:hypothetical protein
MKELIMWHEAKLMCLAMVALAGSGCAATKSGFLSDYGRMHTGLYLQNYRSAPELSGRACSKIYITPVETSRIKNQRDVRVSDIATWLKAAVVSAMHAETRWSVAERAEESTSTLEMAVTYFTPGSSGGRAFAGEFGMGHSAVQVEGRLVDSATNKELACFTERRTDTGPGGFEDIGGDAGSKLVEHMVNHIGTDLIKELSAGRQYDAK